MLTQIGGDLMECPLAPNSFTDRSPGAKSGRFWEFAEAYSFSL